MTPLIFFQNFLSTIPPPPKLGEKSIQTSQLTELRNKQNKHKITSDRCLKINKLDKTGQK